MSRADYMKEWRNKRNKSVTDVTRNVTKSRNSVTKSVTNDPESVTKDALLHDVTPDVTLSDPLKSDSSESFSPKSTVLSLEEALSLLQKPEPPTGIVALDRLIKQKEQEVRDGKLVLTSDLPNWVRNRARSF